MGDNREALLGAENKYFENCPGCKVELLKETNPGIPFKHLLYVWVVVLAAGKLLLCLFCNDIEPLLVFILKWVHLFAALPISSLFPFLYFMVRCRNRNVKLM